MSQQQPIGPVVHSFFADHLITVKGMRPASVRSYRDVIRLLLAFAALRRALSRGRRDAVCRTKLHYTA